MLICFVQATFLVTLSFVTLVSGNFIVNLSSTSTLGALTIDEFFKRYPGLFKHVGHVYSFGSFAGFSGNFNLPVIRALQNNPLVQSVVPDVSVSTTEFADMEILDSLDIEALGSIRLEGALRNLKKNGLNLGKKALSADPIDLISTASVQYDAPRHLARIQQRKRLSSTARDEETFVYKYPSKPKDNVDVYILDTGVYGDHPMLEKRVTEQHDFTGEGFGDGNGHGTHVAGLVGSSKYGAYKQAKFIDVKVLQSGGVGNLSTVIAGIEFVVNHRDKTGKKAVVNLSVGAAFNAVLNEAVNAAASSGIAIVVAAGNSNSAACNYSPASAGKVVTVGAIDDRYDSIASFSNWGRCVDIFASGVYVVSLAGQDSKNKPHVLGDQFGQLEDDAILVQDQQQNGTVALSGTSMSAPIVSGILADFMSQGDDSEQAIDRLLNEGTRGAIPRSSLFFRPKTVNLVAYNNLRIKGSIDEFDNDNDDGYNGDNDDDDEEND